MMLEIAEAEEREVLEGKRKKQGQERVHTGGSDVTMEGVTDEDYENEDEYNENVS